MFGLTLSLSGWSSFSVIFLIVTKYSDRNTVYYSLVYHSRDALQGVINCIGYKILIL